MSYYRQKLWGPEEKWIPQQNNNFVIGSGKN